MDMSFMLSYDFFCHLSEATVLSSLVDPSTLPSLLPLFFLSKYVLCPMCSL